MTTFLRISFAQVLLQFGPRRARQQFQVFLWRQILATLKSGIRYSILVFLLILYFSSSPKKPFRILCERRVSRRELTSSNLHFPNWRCILELARTEFAPRPASRDSEWAGGPKELRIRE